jgi:hypothetical protein
MNPLFASLAKDVLHNVVDWCVTYTSLFPFLGWWDKFLWANFEASPGKVIKRTIF